MKSSTSRSGRTAAPLVFVALLRYQVTSLLVSGQMVPKPPPENNDTVTYVVQLNRENQPLGIILGTDISTLLLYMIYNSLGLTQTGDFMIRALIDGVARR